MLTACVHEVFVVLMTLIHVGTHVLDARIHGVCTVRGLIQGGMLIRTCVRTIHAVVFGEEQSQGV